jgi:hypothetical protein
VPGDDDLHAAIRLDVSSWLNDGQLHNDGFVRQHGDVLIYRHGLDSALHDHLPGGCDGPDESGSVRRDGQLSGANHDRQLRCGHLHTTLRFVLLRRLNQRHLYNDGGTELLFHGHRE